MNKAYMAAMSEKPENTYLPRSYPQFLKACITQWTFLCLIKIILHAAQIRKPVAHVDVGTSIVKQAGILEQTSQEDREIKPLYGC